MADPIYIVGLEYTPGVFTNVTNDVRGFSFSRKVGNIFQGISAGTAQIILSNTDKSFSPDVTTGANAGNLNLNIGVRIQATHSGSTYNLFKGFIDNYKIAPSDRSEKVLTISARDEVKFLNDRTITTSAFANTQINSIVVSVFAEASINSFNVDAITDAPPFVWFDKVQAVVAIKQVMDAGFFSTYVDGAGIFNFKDRLFATDTSNPTPVKSNEFFKFNWSFNDGGIFNRITISGTPRILYKEIHSIGALSKVIELAAGETVGFEVGYQDPENSGEPAPAIEVVAVTSGDFQTNTASDGTGSNQNSATTLNFKLFGASAVATLTNNAGFTIFLTDFTIRGRSAHREGEITFKSESSSSQTLYGIRDFSLNSDFIGNIAYAENYAEFLRDRNANPAAKVEIGLKNDWPYILARELGDAIDLREDHMGVNNIFSIVGMDHTLVTGTRGWQHTARYTLGALTAPFSGSMSKSIFHNLPSLEAINDGTSVSIARRVFHGGEEEVITLGLPFETDFALPLAVVAPYFDGADWLYRTSADSGTAALSGISDGKAMTISFHSHFPSNGDAIFGMSNFAGTGLNKISFSGGNLFMFFSRAAVDDGAYEIHSTGVSLTDTAWHHILISFSGSGTVYLYVDDVDRLGTVALHDDDLNFTTEQAAVGALNVAGNNRLDACLQNLSIEFNKYTDFSIANNRAAYDFGTIAVGSAHIFMSGNINSFEVNRGGGGVFTKVGSFDACSIDAS